MGRLPAELHGAVLPALVDASRDEPVGKTRPTRVRSDEEVVHDPDARCAECVPAPVDRREPRSRSRVVTCDQLDALTLRIGDESLRDGQEVLVGRGDLVEVAVGADER